MKRLETELADTSLEAVGKPTNRLYYRVWEVAQLTGIAERTVWDGIYSGRIPSRKISAVRLIPASFLDDETGGQRRAKAGAS